MEKGQFLFEKTLTKEKINTESTYVPDGYNGADKPANENGRCDRHGAGK